MDEVLPRGTKGGPEGQGQGAQAASTGSLKKRQLQNLLVQVHGNVGPELIWEALQQLQVGMGQVRVTGVESVGQALPTWDSQGQGRAWERT